MRREREREREKERRHNKGSMGYIRSVHDWAACT
jgi:hypothetical protein